jgi:hypothetical protein
MGLIGNNPFYSGPSPWAAGASAFGDNFLKAYLALQTNAREQQAQEMRAQMVQAQMEQMELEKQARAQELTRQGGMRTALQGLLKPVPQTSLDFGGAMNQPPAQIPAEWAGAPEARAVQPEAGLLGTKTEMVRPELTTGGIMGAVLPYATDKDVLSFLGNIASQNQLEQRLGTQMQLQGLRTEAQNEALKQRLENAMEIAKLNAGTKITVANIGASAQERKADLKQQANYVNAVKTKDDLIYDMTSLKQAALKLKDHPGLSGISGAKGALPNVPWSSAAEAEALLKTLQSKTFVSVLAKMRAASATGASGLGQLSEREGDKLEQSWAPLVKKQSTKAMQDALQQIADQSDHFIRQANKIHEMNWGNESGGGGGGVPKSGGSKFTIKKVE